MLPPLTRPAQLSFSCPSPDLDIAEGIRTEPEKEGGRERWGQEEMDPVEMDLPRDLALCCIPLVAPVGFWPAPHHLAPRTCRRRACWHPAAPLENQSFRALGVSQRMKKQQQVLTKGSLCPPADPSQMVKPAGQKRWMVPGARQGLGRASRGQA